MFNYRYLRRPESLRSTAAASHRRETFGRKNNWSKGGYFSKRVARDDNNDITHA